MLVEGHLGERNPGGRRAGGRPVGGRMAVPRLVRCPEMHVVGPEGISIISSTITVSRNAKFLA